MSERMITGLKDIQRRSNKIEDIRGKGSLIGVDTSIDIKTFMLETQKNGLMATQAGDKTFRLTPPLIISEEQVDEALEIIEKTLSEND